MSGIRLKNSGSVIFLIKVQGDTDGRVIWIAHDGRRSGRQKVIFLKKKKARGGGECDEERMKGTIH